MPPRPERLGLSIVGMGRAGRIREARIAAHPLALIRLV